MRCAGILLPLFSLPSPYGIGTMGKEAFDFIDFLKKSGQSIWQMLPIGQTGYGDSPYQSFSSFAGNPYFIDLDFLQKDGLLKKEDFQSVAFSQNDTEIDYALLFQNRYSVLKIACDNFHKTDAKEKYFEFCLKNDSWLEDYALFCAIKDSRGGKSWSEWDKDLKIRDKSALASARLTLSKEIEFYKTVQYFFFRQWTELKEYANKNGILLMGDLPIYASFDSADVWANSDDFELDDNLLPIEVAGCPPDNFAKDGQLWGNPIYNWEKMQKENPKYSFWKKRIFHTLELFDILRIDHFRGFESFYSIPYSEKTAENGRWRKGPAFDLFKELSKTKKDLPIIAENLGFLTTEVYELLEKTGYAGMKVLQFAFDSREENDYLPYNYDKNCVVYTGTHDNDTINGWLSTAPKSDVLQAKKYVSCFENDSFNWAMIKTAMASVADTAIIPMQDFIGLGSEGRINTPGTSFGNWRWRIEKGCINDWLAGIIFDVTKTYGRINN